MISGFHYAGISGYYKIVTSPYWFVMTVIGKLTYGFTAQQVHPLNFIFFILYHPKLQLYQKNKKNQYFSSHKMSKNFKDL